VVLVEVEPQIVVDVDQVVPMAMGAGGAGSTSRSGRPSKSWSIPGGIASEIG
jgi:hypothetical protein